MIGLVAVSGGSRFDMFRTGDSPFFVAVARHPFGSGGVSASPLLYGNAYRYGRILYPLTAWLLALGRPSLVRDALVVVYVASFGAWVAFAAEYLRRSGRDVLLALWIFALPFSLLAFFRPEVISDPMAGALLLLVYLCERDGRRIAVLVAAALLVLTREPLVLGLLPLMWTAWKQRRFAAVRDWVLVILPYASWIVWVRLRVGEFPFRDPGVSRREALAAPFVDWVRIWNLGVGHGQQLVVALAFATMVAAGLVAWRGHWRYPATPGMLALSALIPFLGFAVFRYPAEALRVLAPLQALILLAALDRGGSDRVPVPSSDPAGGR